MRAYAHRHKHIHIHTPTHTSTTGILRASIPECRDAWRFSLGRGVLAIATLGVLTGIPSSSSTLYCYFIPESAVDFVNCFIIILAVPGERRAISVSMLAEKLAGQSVALEKLVITWQEGRARLQQWC